MDFWTYRAVEALGVPVLVEGLYPPISRLNRELTTVAFGLEARLPIYEQDQKVRERSLEHPEGTTNISDILEDIQSFRFSIYNGIL